MARNEEDPRRCGLGVARGGRGSAPIKIRFAARWLAAPETADASAGFMWCQTGVPVDCRAALHA